MTPNEAYVIVKASLAEGLEITGCVDIGDSFVFPTNPVGVDETVPGTIIKQVSKKDGQVSYYDNSVDPSKKDPFESIRRVINGKSVDYKESENDG